MRKLLVLLLSAVSLVAAGAAAEAAATAAKTITITATGYKPTAVSITVGDSVAYKNSDSVAHTVDFKQTTGMHCSAALPLAIAAGQSASCTFSSAGKFNFSDPAKKGNKFRGTVTVNPSPIAGNLTLTPKSVVFGRKTTLAGTLASAQSGQSVQVYETVCGVSSTPKLVTTVTSTTGGKFSYVAQPLARSDYTVKVKNSTSRAARVGVQPRLVLGKVARHQFTVRISAAVSFAGKQVVFQRYRRTLKRWVKVRRVLLRANTTGVAPTVVTSAKFRSKIRTRQKVRVVLGPKQVGACYLVGRSNTIRS